MLAALVGAAGSGLGSMLGGLLGGNPNKQFDKIRETEKAGINEARDLLNVSTDQAMALMNQYLAKIEAEAGPAIQSGAMAQSTFNDAMGLTSPQTRYNVITDVKAGRQNWEALGTAFRGLDVNKLKTSLQLDSTQRQKAATGQTLNPFYWGVGLPIGMKHEPLLGQRLTDNNEQIRQTKAFTDLYEAQGPKAAWDAVRKGRVRFLEKVPVMETVPGAGVQTLTEDKLRQAVEAQYAARGEQSPFMTAEDKFKQGINYQNLISSMQSTNDMLSRQAAQKGLLGSGNFALGLQEAGQSLARKETNNWLAGLQSNIQAGNQMTGQLMPLQLQVGEGLASLTRQKGVDSANARLMDAASRTNWIAAKAMGGQQGGVLGNFVQGFGAGLSRG